MLLIWRLETFDIVLKLLINNGGSISLYITVNNKLKTIELTPTNCINIWDTHILKNNPPTLSVSPSCKSLSLLAIESAFMWTFSPSILKAVFLTVSLTSLVFSNIAGSVLGDGAIQDNTALLTSGFGSDWIRYKYAEKTSQSDQRKECHLMKIYLIVLIK